MNSISRKGELPDFDLVSMYPRKVFSDAGLTLEECGLVQNANIMLVPKK